MELAFKAERFNNKENHPEKNRNHRHPQRTSAKKPHKQDHQKGTENRQADLEDKKVSICPHAPASDDAKSCGKSHQDDHCMYPNACPFNAEFHLFFYQSAHLHFSLHKNQSDYNISPV